MKATLRCEKATVHPSCSGHFIGCTLTFCRKNRGWTLDRVEKAVVEHARPAEGDRTPFVFGAFHRVTLTLCRTSCVDERRTALRKQCAAHKATRTQGIPDGCTLTLCWTSCMGGR